MINRFWTQIIAFAFLLQALVPLGYMPAFAKDGSITIEICSGDTTQQIKINPDDEDTDHEDSVQCPYVLVGGYYASSDVVSLDLPVRYVFQDISVQSVFLFNNVLSAHVPRAPPFIAV